mmetsp:Transcript_6877/g.9147  ORF Transcript_6877/g.9147 Transcript_6877/m.9147 type:complete len:92 (+) Transcript_6877:1165-1440(+)
MMSSLRALPTQENGSTNMFFCYRHVITLLLSLLFKSKTVKDVYQQEDDRRQRLKKKQGGSTLSSCFREPSKKVIFENCVLFNLLLKGLLSD